MDRLPAIFVFLLLFIGFSTSHPLSAEDFDNTAIALRIGYRNDDIHINAHNKLQGANIFRKQSWNNISIFTYGINASTYTEYNVFLRGKLNYGYIMHMGVSVDNPLVNDFTRSRNHNTRGTTYEGEIAVGFPLWIRRCDNYHFIPLVGYSFNRIKARSRDHIHLLLNDSFDSSSHHVNGNIRGQVHIQGPFAGIDFVYRCCWWRFYGTYQFHWGHVRSENHYHMPSNFEFRSSNRCSKGFGNTAIIGAGWQFSTEWETALAFEYKNWHSSNGHQKTVLRTTDSSSRVHARVKKFDWNSWGLTLDLILRY